MTDGLRRVGPCIDCGRLSDGLRCPSCQRAWAMRFGHPLPAAEVRSFEPKPRLKPAEPKRREPAWKRALRRPLWHRERLPHAVSDYNPESVIHQAINRGVEGVASRFDENLRREQMRRELERRARRYG